jgi:hypothetical protein
MKKGLKELISLFTIVGLLTFCFVPLLVNAQDTPPPSPITDPSDIIRTLENVRNIIWAILGFVVVIMFIWAGITFVTAEGDPTKLGAARNRLMYGVIGIIVALLAGGILTLVMSLMR